MFLSGVKFFAVILPALLALFLVLRAIFDENVSDYRYAFALLIIFAVTLFVRVPFEPSEAKRRKRWGRMLLIALPVLLLIPTTFVVLIFGKMDMAAFVFHMIFGMGGTPIENFVPFGFTVLVFWGVFLVSVFRAQYWLERVPYIALPIAVGLLAINPVVRDAFNSTLSEKYGGRASFVADYRVPEITPSAEKPNLILIYLEGLERSYGQRDVSAAAYAPIAALASRGIEFTNVDQLHGTAWSLAGTVASRCGVPVLPNGLVSARDYGDVKLIAPNVTCLDDILHDKGYDVSYISTTRIIGNKMGFYGFDNYFSTHNTDQIYDLSNIEFQKTERVAQSFVKDWGLRDAHAFDQATKLIKAALQKQQPFSVTIATMDTHGPFAFMSDQCLEDGGSYVSKDILDAVRCSSQLTLDFVEKTQELTAGTDTRFVIISDHLAHLNNVHSVLEQGRRRNTAIFIGNDATPRVVDSHGAMFDVFPTLLDWLGWSEGDVAGIGVSLLSETPTLVEVHGVKDVDARLKVDLPLSHIIWNKEEN